MRARVRLQDVANRAGVSVKTVSNVVNGYVHVAADTRARVQAVLDETNYRPNLSARQLRTGRTGVIALALPELDNPYFAELTRFVVQAAEDRGWTVLVDQTDGLRSREQAVAHGIPAPPDRRTDPQPGRARRARPGRAVAGRHSPGAARGEAVCRTGGPRGDRQRGGRAYRHGAPRVPGQEARRGHRRPAEQQSGVGRRAPSPAWLGGGPGGGGTAGHSRAGRAGALLPAQRRIARPWRCSSNGTHRRTPCSASTTRWRWARCGRWPTAGDVFPRTSP